MNRYYGAAPTYYRQFDFDLPEVMYYLYLPVRMESNELRLPPNVECCRPLIMHAISVAPRRFHFAYLSARKGWATPDSPLNRPGWHCDGFGSDDLNFVWWVGPGTRFAIQGFRDISDDHVVSLRQFEEQVSHEWTSTYAQRGLFGLDQFVVHATPLIEPPGCARQYVKVSLSDHPYNLKDNSHNYLFDYDWEMIDRAVVRNDTHRAGQDYYLREHRG